MPPAKKYTTAGAFRQALEERLPIGRKVVPARSASVVVKRVATRWHRARLFPFHFKWIANRESLDLLPVLQILGVQNATAVL